MNIRELIDFANFDCSNVTYILHDVRTVDSDFGIIQIPTYTKLEEGNDGVFRGESVSIDYTKLYEYEIIKIDGNVNIHIATDDYLMFRQFGVNKSRELRKSYVQRKVV